MTRPSWMSGPPGRILLASDLAPRSDRALDRAAALAEQWAAELVVLHVMESSRPDNHETARRSVRHRPLDPLQVARQQLRADLGPAADSASVLIGEGDPVEAILNAVEQEACGLIVIGIARDEPLGRFRLGGIVDRLLRRAEVPLLVVKSRPRPYKHIVVASDFSDASRHALEAALRLFPDQPLTVFHAHDNPLPGLMTDLRSHLKHLEAVAARDYVPFLARVDKPAGAQTPKLKIEEGSPTSLVPDYVRESGADLLVLGSEGRSAFLEFLIGSVAKSIMDEVPCDTLLIREPRAADSV